MRSGRKSRMPWSERGGAAGFLSIVAAELLTSRHSKQTRGGRAAPVVRLSAARISIGERDGGGGGADCVDPRRHYTFATMSVRIISDLDEARRTILRRVPLDDAATTPAMLDRIERLWGARIGPTEVVDRILADVAARGDAALRDMTERVARAAP